MEDFLQSQIRDNCRLALPEGLRDLMSDISREVLRVQPPDLYNFIAGYLEALLLARETLSIACRVCRDVCNCACHPELDEELRNLGLDGEDLEAAKNVVMEYFEKDEVKEGNLLMKLFMKTNFDPNLLPDIQDAVREAFQKHMRVHKAKYWAEAEKANDVVQQAAKHTLEFHERAQEDKELSRDGAATKIQAAFRGSSERKGLDEVALKLRGKLAQIESSNMTLQPPTKEETERPCTSKHARNSILRISLSSSSLAGSLMNLPKYVPYSVHDMSFVDFEERETERTNIDYTLETPKTPKDSRKDEGAKKIAFFEQHVLHEIKSCSIVEEQIEEHIEEDNSEANSVDENIIEGENVDNISAKLENAQDEDVVDVQPLAEVGMKKSGFGIDILISDDDRTSISENIFSKTAANENEMIEVNVSHNETNQHIKEEFADQTSFYDQYEEKNIQEGSGEEEMENKDNITMKKSDRAGSKANIELIKSLRKNSIRLSESGVVDDREGGHSSPND